MARVPDAHAQVGFLEIGAGFLHPHRNPGLMLLQHRNDLLFAEPALIGFAALRVISVSFRRSPIQTEGASGGNVKPLGITRAPAAQPFRDGL